MVEVKEIVKKVFQLSNPEKLTYEWMCDNLTAKALTDLESGILVIAVGKASVLMIKGFFRWIEKSFSDLHETYPMRSVIVFPRGYDFSLKELLDDHLTINKLHESHPIICIQGEHPYPGKGSIEAGRTVYEEVSKNQGTCFFLLSGGASSLMVRPIKGLTLTELRDLYKALVLSGADIREINRIRKWLSTIKGGKLAGIYSGRKMFNLVLSDVTDDRELRAQSIEGYQIYETENGKNDNVLSAVGSSPMYLGDDYPNREEEMNKILEILKKYDLNGIVPDSVFSQGNIFGKEAQGKEICIRSEIIYSNERLLSDLLYFFQENSDTSSVTLFDPIGRSSMEFNVNELVEDFIVHAKNYFHEETNTSRLKRDDSLDIFSPGGLKDQEKKSHKRIFFTGGEPTIKIPVDGYKDVGIKENKKKTGIGMGGRALHTGLFFLKRVVEEDHLRNMLHRISFLSLATDGKDGDSPAAGCYFEGKELLKRIRGFAGLKPNPDNDHIPDPSDENQLRKFIYTMVNKHLDNYDSYHFFKIYAHTIERGYTGTNVLDIYLMWIDQ